MSEKVTSALEGHDVIDQALVLRVLTNPRDVPRETLLDAVTTLTQSDDLEAPARTLLYDIISGVVVELETALRARISENIAARDDVPHDLALVLAQDCDPVALPVLQQSPVLADADLLPIIESRPGAARIAVAARDGVSEVLSDALIQTGDNDVLCALAANVSAHISETALYQLAEIARDYAPLQSPLVHRNDLPQTLQIQMIVWVSAALRTHLLNVLPLSHEKLDDLLVEAVISEIAAFVPSFTDGQEISEGPIDEQRLLATLSAGDVSTCLGMLETLSGAATALVLRAAFDFNGAGLVVFARACGLSRSGFASLFGGLRAMSMQQAETLRFDLLESLHFYDHLEPQDAIDAIVRWNYSDDFERVLNSLR